MKYEIIPSDETIKKVSLALHARNVTTIIVDTKEEALEEIKKLIPKGAEVMNGSSTTLKEAGFMDYLGGDANGWDNVHAKITSEKDPVVHAKLRKESVLADYFLGSVHAITEEGQLLIASGSGSQVPSYAFTSNNVIWVASANKIVADLDGAFDRLKNYVYPLEDKRMKSVGYPGSTIGKILIFEREIVPTRKLTMILVKEKLGF